MGPPSKADIDYIQSLQNLSESDPGLYIAWDNDAIQVFIDTANLVLGGPQRPHYLPNALFTRRYEATNRIASMEILIPNINQSLSGAVVRVNLTGISKRVS